VGAKRLDLSELSLLIKMPRDVTTKAVYVKEKKMKMQEKSAFFPSGNF
jgi:hypothetical protein